MDKQARLSERSGRPRRVLLTAVLLVFVGLPVLALATCTYTAFSPHLRGEPITVALMDAPQHPQLSWRNVDVDLIPDYLQVAQSQTEATTRLADAGYYVFADYSTDIGPRDIHPDDDMPQSSLDAMFARAKEHQNALGITHIYALAGRTRPACGETIFVELGFDEAGLQRATGYSRWTCL